MSKIFSNVVEMSITSSWVILCILALRLALARFPGRYSCILWYAALFRLLSPRAIPVRIGMLPVLQPAFRKIADRLGPGFASGLSSADVVARAVSSAAVPAFGPVSSQMLVRGAALVWILGMAGMLLFAGISYRKLIRQLSGAEKQEENVYLVENLRTPFVLGIFRPRIYLPKDSAAERRCILLHERMHIRRKDPLLKAAACLALVLHWFNPLVWLAFLALERDMERACDEAVLDEMGYGMKKEYAKALLSVSAARTGIRGIPPAFGEGKIKDRIRHVLRYRKPAGGACTALFLIVGAVCLGMAVNPKKDAPPVEGPSWLARAWEWRTPYTGNASAVGNITDAWYTMADAPKDGFELFTEGQPYGARIRFRISEESGLDAQGILENYSSIMEENVGVLFALVENLGYVEITFDDTDTWRFEREDYEARYGDLWEQTETLEGLIKLYEEMQQG